MTFSDRQAEAARIKKLQQPTSPLAAPDPGSSTTQSTDKAKPATKKSAKKAAPKQTKTAKPVASKKVAAASKKKSGKGK
jgi:hypothetical protein